ncbi:MAG TPA: hypothetical protein VG474_10790 [Solirubrobacteraceae bacterium]|nr:hypothetical protein [Solirubrobacteraceae bacterium]
MQDLEDLIARLRAEERVASERVLMLGGKIARLRTEFERLRAPGDELDS